MMKIDMETLKKAKQLLELKKELEYINRRIEDYTDDWVRTQKNIIKIEEELQK